MQSYKKRRKNFKITKEVADSIISVEEYSKTQIKRIVHKSFDFLNKTERANIEYERNNLENIIYNTIIIAGKDSKVQPYSALKQHAKKVAEEKIWDRHLPELWKRFKDETTHVFWRYSNYVRSVGLSPKGIFFDKNYNTIIYDRATIESTITMPYRIGGGRRKTYKELRIVWSLSGNYFSAELVE